MVRQTVPLQPMEGDGGADIHLQPVEDPTPENVEVPEGSCDPVGVTCTHLVLKYYTRKRALRIESFNANNKAEMSDNSNHFEWRHADLQQKPKAIVKHYTTVTHRSNSVSPKPNTLPSINISPQLAEAISI
ncbi:AN1-type zinc finger protein 5-like [Grus japonensis]|uniref:AN1-type zinc finger protein 5-like n=1 Tax=Grus japonensis TaxID=30415 RepID=A0ABC9Y3Z7_GRUJA